MMASYRRILLDRDLEDAKTYMKGIVLDVGGGRKRGDFNEPDGVFWIVLDGNRNFCPQILGDAQCMPVMSNVVDCVKCTELLEHVEYPETVIHEILRVLKPEGVLILSMPFNFGIHGDPYDFQRFTDEKLRRILNPRFEVVILKKQGLFFNVLSHMIKQSIINSKSGTKRFFIPLFPLLDLLVKIDNSTSVKDSEYMSSFTTGFFVIAFKKRVTP